MKAILAVLCFLVFLGISTVQAANYTFTGGTVGTNNYPTDGAQYQVTVNQAITLRSIRIHITGVTCPNTLSCSLLISNPDGAGSWLSYDCGGNQGVCGFDNDDLTFSDAAYAQAVGGATGIAVANCQSGLYVPGICSANPVWNNTDFTNTNLTQLFPYPTLGVWTLWVYTSVPNTTASYGTWDLTISDDQPIVVTAGGTSTASGTSTGSTAGSTSNPSSTGSTQTGTTTNNPTTGSSQTTQSSGTTTNNPTTGSTQTTSNSGGNSNGGTTTSGINADSGASSLSSWFIYV